MEEIWKDVLGYDGLYQVSNLGRVKSLERTCWNGNGVRVVKERVLRHGKTKNGYLTVHLYLSGKSKTYYIHQLVAIAFLNHSNDDRRLVVDHIDKDKTNNNVSNIRIVTQRFNVARERVNTTSKHTGVYRSKSGKRWSSRINIDGKDFHLGCFGSELEALKAYNDKLKEIWGGTDTQSKSLMLLKKI